MAASSQTAATLTLRYGVSESTVYKWKGRDSFNDASHTPNRLQTKPPKGGATRVAAPSPESRFRAGTDTVAHGVVVIEHLRASYAQPGYRTRLGIVPRVLSTTLRRDLEM